MKAKSENVAADASRRPGRVRGARKFGILSAMSLMTATALVGADRAVNSFVAVEGEGVSLDADGSICVDEGSSGSLTVSARPGWLVNGRESVTGNPANGTLRDLSMTSRLGESTQHLHVFPFTEREEHVPDECNELSVAVDPRGIVKVYALPAASAEVSAEATATVARKARHRKVKTYSKCSFRGCNERHDPEVEYGEPFEVEPDRYAWTATAEGQTSNGSAWTGYMGKGTGKEIKFHVKGTRSGCADCECEAEATAKADVYELSIDLRDEFLGLNLKDEMKGKYVTRDASAKIDPEPKSVAYSWVSCGQCDFIGDTDKADVTYGATDKNKGSGRYRAEDLVVCATVTNEDGLTDSASCTTNFTVVRVDVVLSGVSEAGDETAIPPVCYIADEDGGGLSKAGLRYLHPVAVTCVPADVPGPVGVAIDVGAKLYEITESSAGVPSSAVPAQGAYLGSDIGQKKFGIHGHILVGDAGDEKLMAAVHRPSKAIDVAKVKVVPPPPLEVTVQFDSPADGGAWPYDPVWDDPEWYPTIDGSRADLCAENTDVALVIYTLSRDAAKVDGIIYKRIIPLLPGLEVDSFEGDSSEGTHTDAWCMEPAQQTGAYYAEVVAIEKETGEPRDAKSDDGEVVRHSYCTAGASPVMTCQYICPVQWEEHFLDSGERYVTVTLLIADPVLFISGLAHAVGASVAFVAGATGVMEHLINVTISFTTTIGTVPDWLRPGVCVFGCSWKVIRWEWDDDKYVKASRVTVPGLPHSPEATVINGEFEIGYLCYAQWFQPKDGVLEGRYNALHSGFYCNETTSSADSNIGYQLQDGWKWNEKWYGLLRPIIEVPQVQQAD